jgi:hypothetical protein
VIWTIQPDQPVARGKRVTLNFAYDGVVTKSLRFMHVGPEVSFANSSRENWLPKPVGLRSLGKLRFVVPRGLTVAAAGVKTSTAPEEKSGIFRFENKVPSEPWFAAGAYQVVETDGAIPGAAYVLKSRPGISAYLDGSARIIEVLSRNFGAYPFGRFSLVEIPLEVTQRSGGFNALGSAGGILTQGGAFDEPFNLAYFGHEIGHQWWGNVISRDPSDGRGDYMLDEAMPDLGSLLAVQAIEGAGAAESYRRDGYPGFSPEFYSARGYLKLAAAGLDTPLSRLPDAELSMRLARSKGGRVWYALAEEIGPEKFPAVMSAVVRKHAFAPVTWTAFLESLSTAAGRDLSWFYSDYFDRKGAPQWLLEWAPGRPGHTEVIVRQSEPVYRATLPLELMGAAGQRTTYSLAVSGLSNSVSVGAPNAVQTATLDPRYTRLQWTPEYRAEAYALAGFTRARMAEGTQARLRILREALAQVRDPDTYAARYQIRAFMGSLLAAEKSWKEARLQLEAAVQDTRALPDRLPLTYVRLATVAKALGDDQLLHRAVAGAIAADAAVGNSTGAAEQARALLTLSTNITPP